MLRSLQAEELRQSSLLQFGADDAQPAGIVGPALPDLPLPGDKIELQPAPLTIGNDALGPEDLAVLTAVQGGEYGLDLRLGKGLGAFLTPALEGLVGVTVVVMMVMVVFVALMIVVMAAAGAVRTVLMFVMVSAAAVLTIFMMVMLMFMLMPAAAVFTVFVVMMFHIVISLCS